MASDKEEEEPRYYGMELGVIVDVDDPKGLGRVRLIVPGLLDAPSPWAPQIGTLKGGGPQRGMFSVPPKGSDVAVFFHRGDPQKPYFVAGHFGTRPDGGDEVPTDVKAAKLEERKDVTSFETEHWIWTFDDRPSASKAQIRHKVLDLVVDLDGKKGVVEIVGDAAVSIKSTGLVVIDGAEVKIGGRVVMQNGKPIG